MDKTSGEKPDANWRIIYQTGAVAAILYIVAALSEIIISFLPGAGNTAAGPLAVVDWFVLFQNNWFIGLRNLGLLNICFMLLSIPIFLALYAAHQRVDKPLAALALIISFIGTAVFLGTNRAFPMLALSNQYAAATTDVQRAALAAAAQAMLAVGLNHTPGTFLAFFLSEIAGILISVVMMRSRVFNQVNAYVGILAFVLLLFFEICSSFAPAFALVALISAMGGGILNLVWYILVASRLFQLGRVA
jgi:hypothetical protein